MEVEGGEGDAEGVEDEEVVVVVVVVVADCSMRIAAVLARAIFSSRCALRTMVWIIW